MKVLVISFFNQWLTHLGTELELAQLHLDKGDLVEFLGCDSCIIACQPNPQGDKDVCNVCRLRRNHGLKLLSSPTVEHRLGDYLSTEALKSEDEILSTISDVKSAKDFRFHGHDLGWGALSSTIMDLRDPVCETPKAQELLKRFSRTALRSYLAVRAFLKSHGDFDRVYVFNGRFACTRGAFRACQEHEKMEIIIHERGSSIEKYDLFPDSMPHNRDLWHERIEAEWEAAGSREDRDAVGRAFYDGRRNGTPLDWKSFTSQQKENLLPSDWDGSKRNILIFNSSEDEFAGIGDDWNNSVYPLQNEGIRRVVTEALVRYPDVHFYLRMHPNLMGVNNKDVAMLLAFKSPNLTLIEPASSISSYALLDLAERVLTFGSTVGVEATFWGRISILAGPSIYEHLDATHVARDHEHVMELLGADLKPKPFINALKYGYYLRSFGIPFRYWKADGFFNGSFHGVPLGWSPATRFEGRVLIRLHELGLRSKFLQNVVHACSKVAGRLWFGGRRRIRKFFAKKTPLRS